MVFTWQSVNFAKCNTEDKQKINFLPDEITTAYSACKVNVKDDNDRAVLLERFYKFHFDVHNAKPDITECFVVTFVEQLDKTLLDWCENRWINYLNAKININRIFLSYNCD